MVFVFAPPSLAVRVLCTVATGLTVMRIDWSAPRELTNSSPGDTSLIVDCGGEKQNVFRCAHTSSKLWYVNNLVFNLVFSSGRVYR